MLEAQRTQGIEYVTWMIYFSWNNFKLISVSNMIQVIDSIPWVRCASGNVYSHRFWSSTFGEIILGNIFSQKRGGGGAGESKVVQSFSENCKMQNAVSQTWGFNGWTGRFFESRKMDFVSPPTEFILILPTEQSSSIGQYKWCHKILSKGVAIDESRKRGGGGIIIFWGELYLVGEIYQWLRQRATLWDWNIGQLEHRSIHQGQQGQCQWLIGEVLVTLTKEETIWKGMNAQNLKKWPCWIYNSTSSSRKLLSELTKVPFMILKTT